MRIRRSPPVDQGSAESHRPRKPQGVKHRVLSAPGHGLAGCRWGRDPRRLALAGLARSLVGGARRRGGEGQSREPTAPRANCTPCQHARSWYPVCSKAGPNRRRPVRRAGSWTGSSAAALCPEAAPKGVPAGAASPLFGPAQTGLPPAAALGRYPSRHPAPGRLLRPFTVILRM